MHIDLFDKLFVPQNLMSCSFTKVPDCPTLRFLTSSEVKKKNSDRCVCANPKPHTHTKHDLRLPPVLHTSYARLSISTIMSKCLLRVLCPVRRSVTTLDCTLLEDSSLTLATGVGPEISSGSCLRVPVRAKWSLDGHFVEVSR
jgi:hypothetical protein